SPCSRNQGADAAPGWPPMRPTGAVLDWSPRRLARPCLPRYSNSKWTPSPPPECAGPRGFVPEGVLAYEDGVALLQRFNRLDQTDAHQGTAVGQAIAGLVSAVSSTEEGVHD